MAVNCHGGGICLNINKLQNVKFNPFAIATGCSLGVDSFSSIEKYTAKDCLEGYRLNYLTFFNAGSYGSDNLDKARESYNHDLKLVKDFGKDVGLPVIEIETNFAILYTVFKDYNETGFIRNMSVVLSMQKLFKRYMYASTYQVNDLNHGWCNYFYLAAQLLSTANTQITITFPIQTRTEKTRMILDNPLTYKYLNVCWGYQWVNKGDKEMAKVKEKYINCCRCDKCLRTILTIDILGYKDNFSDIFDLEHYEKEKAKYIGKVLSNKSRNNYYKEICDYIDLQQYKITTKSRLYALGYRLRINSILLKIKKILFWRKIIDIIKN